MHQNFLRQNQILLIDQTLYRVLYHDRDARIWDLENVQNREVERLTYQKAYRLYQEDRLNLNPTNGQPWHREVVERQRWHFAQYSDKQREEALRRRPYVEAVLRAGADHASGGGVRAIIEQVARDRPSADGPVPTVRSVQAWLGPYKGMRGDVRALVPNYHKRGNRQLRRYVINNGQRVCHEICEKEESLLKYLLMTFCCVERSSKASVYKFVKKGFSDENVHREEDRKLKVPSRATVYRRLNDLNPYETTVARFGKKKANEMFKLKKGVPKPDHVLDIVEVDATRMDIFVTIRAQGLALGRPWITVALDRKTKVVLGFYIGFEPPSELTVLRCLKHAIAPKPDYADTYGMPNMKWPWYGIPQLVLVDNAIEYMGRSVSDAALQLGFEVEPHPVKQPNWKGSVERFFGTLASQPLDFLPGKTFRNVIAKDEYEPQKLAVLELGELRSLIIKWVALEYNVTRHEGVEDVPARLWEEAVQTMEPTLPAKISDLDVLDKLVRYATLTAKGVRFENLYYQSDEMQVMFNRNANIVVKLLVDPDNLHFIQVQDPTTGELSAAYIRHDLEAYADGLTLVEHFAIRRFKRQRAAEYEGSLNLETARRLFRQEMYDICRRKSSKVRDRTKVALALGGELESHDFTQDKEEAVTVGSEGGLGCDTGSRHVSKEHAQGSETVRGNASGSGDDSGNAFVWQTDNQSSQCGAQQVDGAFSEDDYERLKSGGGLGSRTYKNPS